METQLLYSVFASVLMLAFLFAIYYFFVSKSLTSELNVLEIYKNNFETISKKANDIILVIDIITGKIYNANIKASELLAYPFSKLYQKTIHDLYPKELLDLSAQTIAEVWDKKGLVYQNLPFVTSQGDLLEVESSAKVLIYNDKPVIVIYARDIRDRLELEREVQLQNQLIADKNKNITSSIRYASRIQNAVLGQADQLNALFNNSFVFFKPHSIVSGDFYWFGEIDEYKIVIAADSTGHGVPGAFMTLLGYNFLDEIIDNKKNVMPDEILSELNQKISLRLNKDSANQKVNDGMDMAILTFDTKKNKVYFSGAKNPLCIVQNNELEVIKATKYAIGGQLEEKEFELHEFDLKSDTIFYIYSDGFQDQFGGNKNRKFLSKNFRALLLKMSELELAQQKTILEDSLKIWIGDNSQTDDILVIGVRV